jgi:hypothetical protein
MPVIPGENPFHCETGSTWTQASETLSTVVIDIACAICSSDNPNNFPVPAAVEIASWIGVIETLCHDRHHGGEPALDLERNSKREHELFA